MRRLLILLGLLAVLAGCRERATPPSGPLETVLDLTAGLGSLEIDREPSTVDAGTPEARAWLREGFSRDETGAGGTFVWSDGPESRIDFFLAVPRDVPLSLKGQAYPAAGAPPQNVALLLNGQNVGEVRIRPEISEQRLVLPARLARAGTNQLVLRYAWTRSPWQESHGREDDRRHLAVAWDGFRFETGVDESARVRAAGDRLALPFGWRVTAYFPAPAGAVLAWDDLRSRDAQASELWVDLETEEGSGGDGARFPPKGGAARVAVAKAGVVRLSLAAVPAQPGGPTGGGLVLRKLLVQAPGGSASNAAGAAERGLARRPRNVVVYLVDTLRADHLGCYGYAPPVSPHIDAFAREATLFRHAVAQSPWTRPSVATILTGLLPVTHGVNRKKLALAPEAVTLAEALKAKGYRTAGFVTNGNVAKSFGFAQGFDTYELLGRKRSAATDVHARAALWLEQEWKGEAPFFLYLHTVEPHAPYAPPEPFRGRFAPGVRDEALTRMRFLHQIEEGKVPATPELRRDLLALYDAEIAANDAAFGELVGLLRRRGLWEDTLVVFVSDHGEEFLDHGGWEHGKTLHAEMLDVPLILRIPGIGKTPPVERQAQHADIVPTVLDALGIPIPPAVEGRSLLPWMLGAGPPAGTEEAFSWLNEYGVQAAAVTTPEWRLIEQRLPGFDRSLYDRKADPREQENRAAQHSLRSAWLASRVHAAQVPRPGGLEAQEGVMDPEVRRQLRALGYLH